MTIIPFRAERADDLDMQGLAVWLIYCAHCGWVVGATGQQAILDRLRDLEERLNTGERQAQERTPRD